MYKATMLLAAAFACLSAAAQSFPLTIKLALERRADTSLVNESTVRYLAGQSNTRVSSFDALLWGFATEQTGSVKDTNLLSLHTRSFQPSLNDSVALLVRGHANQLYFLRVETFAVPAGTQVFLRDIFLNTQVMLQAQMRYSFQVTAAPASQGTGRFQLLVRNSAALATGFCGAPVVHKQGHGLAVKICLQQDDLVKQLVLERQQEAGQAFAAVAVQPGQTAMGRKDIEMVDPQPVLGASFYRVSAQKADGRWIYSAVARMDGQAVKVQCFPNPVVNELHVAASSGATAQVVDAQGRVVARQLLAAGSATLATTHWPAGNYFLQLRAASGQLLLSKTIVK